MNIGNIDKLPVGKPVGDEINKMEMKMKQRCLRWKSRLTS